MCQFLSGRRLRQQRATSLFRSQRGFGLGGAVFLEVLKGFLKGIYKGSIKGLGFRVSEN